MLAALLLFAFQDKKLDPKAFYDPGAAAPAWQGQGGIKSDDLKNEHRDSNGNVEGTEFFHLEYNVSTRIVDLPESEWLPDVYIYCANECQGKKHKNHTECDLSCDIPCKGDHHFVMKGFVDQLNDNRKKMMADSASLAKKGYGGADPPDWSSKASDALKAAEKDCNNSKVDMTPPPHTKDPCTVWERTYGYKPKQFQIHCEMRKVGFYMSKGIKTPIDERVGTQDGVASILWYPSPDVMDDVKGVVCACEKKVTPPKDPLEEWFRLFDEGPSIWDLGGGLDWDDFFSGKIDIFGKGKDLNEAEIDIENNTGHDVKVKIPPGTMLDSEDDGDQSMAVLEALEVLCAANSTTRVCFGNGATALHPRVECTEMTKHMPSEKTKFKVHRAHNDKLTQLCQMYGKENFHFGSLDQTRAWILLSHARIDEINQRLIPHVTPGTYLTALSDVSSVGVDVFDKEYRACADLDLLLGATSRKPAVKWFIQSWERQDARSLTSFMTKLVAHEKEVLPGGDSSETRHAADLAAALGTCDSPALRDAGLTILLDAVPAEKRATVVQNGGLDSLMNSLESGGEDEVLKALAVVDAYGAKVYLNQVASLSAYSPSAKVKDAAKALKAKL